MSRSICGGSLVGFGYDRNVRNFLLSNLSSRVETTADCYPDGFWTSEHPCVFLTSYSRIHQPAVYNGIATTPSPTRAPMLREVPL
jgi:hypothetical protein